MGNEKGLGIKAQASYEVELKYMYLSFFVKIFNIKYLTAILIYGMLLFSFVSSEILDFYP